MAKSLESEAVPALASTEAALDALAPLLPGIAERGLATERARRVLPETVDELQRAGLLRVVTPARYGGAELDYDTALLATAKIGTACASTAWCYGVWMGHSWRIGLCDERVQDEIWGDSPDTLVCSSTHPRQLEVSEVKGGVRVSGHTDFASGCDSSQWAMLMGEWSAGMGYLFVPMTETEILDNWYPSGLRGTGSKDLLLHDVFVPAHRAVPIAELRSRVDSASGPRRAGYRVPMQALFAYTVAAPLVGAAQGAVEAFVERMRRQAAEAGESPPSEFAAAQLRVAESSAEVDAAELIMTTAIASAMAGARAGGPEMAEIELARRKRDQCYVARLASSAVNRLFDASGAHALHESSPLQRFHRDVAAGVHQLGLQWDRNAEDYGRLLQGLPARVLRL